jgi:hypothetical protein
MAIKFRLIQSNNRGLVTKVGDRTFASRRPAKGEEELELPTLFIWVNGKNRFLARCWTKWTGEKIGDDFIYVVTKFRDVLDLAGDTRYHQWCSIKLRENLWLLEEPQVNISELTCPLPEDVHATGRFKSATYIERRKQRIIDQTPELTEIEKEQIKQIYKERTRLNDAAGCILYHVDHKVPLSKGGLHHPTNLTILKASVNIVKGARLMPC